jgi:hypothetical protein
MTCDEAIQALREGNIVRRVSWPYDTFVSPMVPGSKRAGRPERTACLCVPGSCRHGWYPTDEDKLAEDWEIMPSSGYYRRYIPNFGSPRDFRLGLNPRWPRIFKQVADATGLRNHEASDLVLDVARLNNPRTYFNDELFSGWADDAVVAHILRHRNQSQAAE